MTSANSTFNFERPSVSSMTEEMFLNRFTFLGSEMNVRSELINTMINEYKKEMKNFELLKKAVDQNDTPAFLQSVVYSSLSSSQISYTPAQLRELAIEFIIATYSKINRLYWVALLEKINAERFFMTQKAKHLIDLASTERYISAKDAYDAQGYSEFYHDDVKSFYICPAFTAKAVGELFKELIKPLNRVEIASEFEKMKSSIQLEVKYSSGRISVYSQRNNTLNTIVSMLYMAKFKKDWGNHFSNDFLIPQYQNNAKSGAEIPSEFNALFEKLCPETVAN